MIKITHSSLNFLIAKTNKVFSYIFGIPGGALIGYPIGTAISGRDFNWALVGIGAGLVGISVPFTSGYNKNAKNAARLYNESVMSTTSSFQPDIRFSVKGNGISLVITYLGSDNLDSSCIYKKTLKNRYSIFDSPNLDYDKSTRLNNKLNK